MMLMTPYEFGEFLQTNPETFKVFREVKNGFLVYRDSLTEKNVDFDSYVVLASGDICPVDPNKLEYQNLFPFYLNGIVLTRTGIPIGKFKPTAHNHASAVRMFNSMAENRNNKIIYYAIQGIPVRD